MTMNIQYVKKNVYGKDNLYVVSEHQEVISALTNKKTIDQRTMQLLGLMGYTFTQVLN